MTTSKHPESTYNRVASLYDYGILDTESRNRFHQLTRIVCALLDTPVAVFSFADRESHCYRSHLGFDEKEIAHIMAEFQLSTATGKIDKPLVINDTLNDAQLAAHPLVASGPKLRFLAVFPLITKSGALLGTLSAMDYQPREIELEKFDAVVSLNEILMNQIELHHLNNQLISRNWELEEKMDILEHNYAEVQNMLDFGQAPAQN